jgi:hypothetical protein
MGQMGRMGPMVSPPARARPEKQGAGAATTKQERGGGVSTPPRAKLRFATPGSAHRSKHF